jgi:hypothetical protein
MRPCRLSGGWSAEGNPEKIRGHVDESAVLSRAEVDAANNGMMGVNVGKGIERLTARALRADPVQAGLLQHMGGPSLPDFVGKGGAFGVQFEVTTYKAFGEHLTRPYGQGLVPALYERPNILSIP